MRVLALAVGVAAVSGCLGAAAGPGIPNAELAERGWSFLDRTTTEAYKLVEIVSQQYGPAGSGTVGGVMVVSVTEIPLVEEERFVPEQLDAYAARQGITLVEQGTETLTLPNAGGRTVDATVYDVDGAGVPAQALVTQFHCEVPATFVVAVGYGALPGGGLLGGADVYEDARDLVQAVACAA